MHWNFDKARWRYILSAALLVLSFPVNAADLVDDVNALRSRGCAGAPGTKAKLKQTRALDEVAQVWAKGGRLQQALEKTGYRAVNSSSMRVSGAPNDAAVIQVLGEHYCKIVTNGDFTEVGIEQRGRDAWVVVATPLNLPSAKSANSIAREVLQLVNEARSKARRCGGKSFAATEPVKLSMTLNQAAMKHAQDMAKNSHFEHQGTDGSTPAQRATAAGYRWRHVAENIAAGAPDAASVVTGWLNSPGHCVNIMGPQYREMGIAYALNDQSEAGIYWAQTFATAR